jgi:two-component system, cell cycle sensor histidine kinase and response regulator CckA
LGPTRRAGLYAADLSSSSIAPLTNAAQVLQLTREQAGQAPPVQLRGVVTYVDPQWKTWFVQDQTAGVYFLVNEAGPGLSAGQEITLSGIASPGGFAPIVEARTISVEGPGQLPKSRLLSSDELIGGGKDSQWVEVEGIVRSAVVEDGHLHLEVDAAQRFHAYAPSSGDKKAPSGLVDARVRLSGVWASVFNSQGQLSGYQLFFQDPSHLKVVEPARAEAFDLPQQPVAAALRFGNAKTFGHRIRLAGVVTAVESDEVFYLQDASGGVRVRTRGTKELHVGDRVEAAGFPQPGQASPGLDQAVVRRIGPGDPPAPISVDTAEGLDSMWESKRVTLSAELINNTERGDQAEMVLYTGREFIRARLAGADAIRELRQFTPGSRLQITGACSVRTDEHRRPVSISLTLGSPADIRVLRAAPWWTIPRTLAVSGLTTFLLLGWRFLGLRREARLNRQYRELIEKAPDPIFVEDSRGRVIEVNQAACDLQGIPKEKLIGTNVSELVPPEARSRIAHELERVAAGEITTVGGFDWNANNRIVPVEITASRITHEGKPALLLSVRDVSERERAAQSLRASEEKYRLIVNHIGETVMVVGLDLRYRFASPSVAKLYGYSPEEFLALSPEQIMSPESFREAQRAFEEEMALEASGTADPLRTRVMKSLEYRKDGSEIRVENTFSFIRDADSKPTQILCVSKDITERQQTEEALHLSEERARALIDHAPEAIVVLDVETGRFITHNPQAERLFGYTGDELDRLGPAELSPPTQPDGEPSAAKAMRLIRQALEGGTPVFEWTHRNKDGKDVPCELRLLRLPARGQHLVRGSITDITARKQAEAERLKLEAQLRQALKMEAVGTLAGGIAHDFNNILGAIIGNAEMLRMDLARDLPAQEGLEQILKASHRAKELVQQILSFSRANLPESVVLDLRPVVEETVRLLRATLPATVELTTHLAKETPLVAANPTEIHQVLLNVCTNAWHALQGRPGQITLRLEDASVERAVPHAQGDLRPGRYARVSIHDTGSGMDPTTIERIFDPFFTTKEVGQGTGLGLAVVHGIMTKYRGAITVASSRELGTAFELYFPAVDGRLAAAPSTVEPATAHRGKGQRILYLDDEASLVKLSTRVLERQGYRVTGLTSANEALAALRADPASFDLLMTDYNMPGASGLDVVLEVQALRPDLPVVLTSGYLTETIKAEAKAANVRQLLGKPYRADELCRIVHEIVGSVERQS